MADGNADRLARLMAVRDTLAEAIAGCDSRRDLAALSREYRACLAELESLPKEEKKRNRGVDEIGRRRAARRAAAENQSHTNRAGR